MYQHYSWIDRWVGWRLILAAWVLLLCVGLIGSGAHAYAPGKTAQEQSFAAQVECPLGGIIVDTPTVAGASSFVHGIGIHTANDIWAVGDSNNENSNLTLTMHWDGSSWSIVPSPNPGSLMNTLSDVAVISEDEAWAVGFYSNGGLDIRTLILHWDGSEWTSLERSPNPGVTFNTLYDVVALSADDVWAVGRYRTSEGRNRTLTLHWDGNTWTHVPSPSIEGRDNLIFGVSAISPDDIWAAGYYWDQNSAYDTRTLFMHWDGTSWSIVNSPQAGFGYNTLYALTAIATNDAWAVGYSSQGTLTMHWDGSSWTVVPSNFRGVLMGVGAVPGGEVWAVGYGGTGATERTVILRWNGSQWSLLDSLNSGPSRNSLRDIEALSDGTIWAVGEYDYADPPTVRSHTMAQQYGVLPPFSDVPPGSTFYPYVRCLTCMGIISGYDDGTFRPNNNVTRGQLSKIVSNSAGFQEPPGTQIFEDVPPGSPFYEWIQRLASRGHIGGYPCGGAGEPCISGNKPYFRPNNNATRAQISKIVSNARGYNEQPGTQIFEDVPPTHPFYEWIQRLAQHGAMGGYECGGAGEPCGAERRPYFRPNNNATRGQTSKIVSNTFFPQCTP